MPYKPTHMCELRTYLSEQHIGHVVSYLRERHHARLCALLNVELGRRGCTPELSKSFFQCLVKGVVLFAEALYFGEDGGADGGLFGAGWSAAHAFFGGN